MLLFQFPALIFLSLCSISVVISNRLSEVWLFRPEHCGVSEAIGGMALVDQFGNINTSSHSWSCGELQGIASKTLNLPNVPFFDASDGFASDQLITNKDNNDVCKPIATELWIYIPSYLYNATVANIDLITLVSMNDSLDGNGDADYVDDGNDFSRGKLVLEWNSNFGIRVIVDTHAHFGGFQVDFPWKPLASLSSNISSSKRLARHVYVFMNAVLGTHSSTDDFYNGDDNIEESKDVTIHVKLCIDGDCQSFSHTRSFFSNDLSPHVGIDILAPVYGGMCVIGGYGIGNDTLNHHTKLFLLRRFQVLDLYAYKSSTRYSPWYFYENYDFGVDFDSGGGDFDDRQIQSPTILFLALYSVVLRKSAIIANRDLGVPCACGIDECVSSCVFGWIGDVMVVEDASSSSTLVPDVNNSYYTAQKLFGTVPLPLISSIYQYQYQSTSTSIDKSTNINAYIVGLWEIDRLAPSSESSSEGVYSYVHVPFSSSHLNVNSGDASIYGQLKMCNGDNINSGDNNYNRSFTSLEVSSTSHELTSSDLDKFMNDNSIYIISGNSSSVQCNNTGNSNMYNTPPPEEEGGFEGAIGPVSAFVQYQPPLNRNSPMSKTTNNLLPYAVIEVIGILESCSNLLYPNGNSLINSSLSSSIGCAIRSTIRVYVKPAPDPPIPLFIHAHALPWQKGLSCTISMLGDDPDDDDDVYTIRTSKNNNFQHTAFFTSLPYLGQIESLDTSNTGELHVGVGIGVNVLYHVDIIDLQRKHLISGGYGNLNATTGTDTLSLKIYNISTQYQHAYERLLNSNNTAKQRHNNMHSNGLVIAKDGYGYGCSDVACNSSICLNETIIDWTSKESAAVVIDIFTPLYTRTPRNLYIYEHTQALFQVNIFLHTENNENVTVGTWVSGTPHTSDSSVFICAQTNRLSSHYDSQLDLPNFSDEQDVTGVQYESEFSYISNVYIQTCSATESSIGVGLGDDNGGDSVDKRASNPFFFTVPLVSFDGILLTENSWHRHSSLDIIHTAVVFVFDPNINETDIDVDIYTRELQDKGWDSRGKFVAADVGENENTKPFPAAISDMDQTHIHIVNTNDPTELSLQAYIRHFDEIATFEKGLNYTTTESGYKLLRSNTDLEVERDVGLGGGVQIAGFELIGKHS